MEAEIETGFAKNNSSHCRNLVRVKRVIDLVRVMLEQTPSSGYVKLSPFHTLILCFKFNLSKS